MHLTALSSVTKNRGNQAIFECLIFWFENGVAMRNTLLPFLTIEGGSALSSNADPDIWSRWLRRLFVLQLRSNVDMRDEWQKHGSSRASVCYPEDRMDSGFSRLSELLLRPAEMIGESFNLTLREADFLACLGAYGEVSNDRGESKKLTSRLGTKLLN